MKENYSDSKKFNAHINLTKPLVNYLASSGILNKFKKLTAAFLMMFITNFVVANSITLSSISSSQGCFGTAATVTVTFTKTGTFFPGNVFTAQLSDGSGSFASPTNIGSVTSTIATPIAAVIPAGTPVGSGYLIRVIGSNNSNTSNNGQVNGNGHNHITISKNSLGYIVNAAVTPSVSIAITAGTNPGCAGSSVTFEASTANGGTAPSYQWQINAVNAGTNSSTFTSSTLTNGQTVTCVMASNATCTSPASTSSNSITMIINPNPAKPGAISGPKVVCGLASATYSVPAVTGATSYNWSVPAGITINSGIGTRIISVNIDPSFISGSISVASVNGCGASALRTATLSITPPVPGTISGPAMVCGLSSATYSIAAVAGATSYNWTVPAGVSIDSGQGTRTINVSINSSFTSGNISVAAVNACGSSALRNLALHTIPKTPGAISGPSMVCGLSSATYSIVSVTGATSYTWVVPAGVSINSGQGTTSISVSFTAFTSGYISVVASNSCGTSAMKKLALYSTPKAPGTISGPSNVCGITSTTYSVAAVTGAISYNWTTPAGISIVSGQGTMSLSVSIDSTFDSGNITVTASNACGTGIARTLVLSGCRSYAHPVFPGLENANSDFPFNIYPNPTDGFSFNLQFAEGHQEILVTIYDITGKVSYSKTIFTGDKGDHVFAIDPSNKLSPGIYMVTASSNQKTHTKKIIVK